MENKFKFRSLVFNYILLIKQNRIDFDVFFSSRTFSHLSKLSFLFFFLFTGVLNAQISATWPLTSNGNPNVVGGFITALPMSIGGLTNQSFGVNGFSAQGFNNNSCNPNNADSLVFQITNTSSTFLEIDTAILTGLTANTASCFQLRSKIDGNTEVAFGNNITLTTTAQTFTTIRTSSLSLPPSSTVRFFVRGAAPNQNTLLTIKDFTIKVHITAITATVGNTIAICSGQTANLTVVNIQGGTPPYSVVWDNSAGTCPNVASGGNCNKTTGALVSSTNFTATITDGLGVTASFSQQVNVVTPPTVNAGLDTSVCFSSGAIDISALATASNASSVQWTSSGSGTFTGATTLNNAFYTPSAADITAGSVTLTLTASNSPCSNVSDTRILTISQAPIVNAGPNISTCSNSGTTNISSGATASNVSSVLWTSSGTGTFTSANTLNGASYTPSSADITAGSVTLTLTANGISPCASVSDTRTLTIIQPPSNVNAGLDTSVCFSSGSIDISALATASNFSSVNWTSSGSGTFTGSTTLNNAFYTPSSADITLGSVTLTLIASGNSPCSSVSDTRTITIKPAPGVNAGPNITTCSNSGAINISTGASASNFSSPLWTSSGSGTFTSANSLNSAIYTPSANDITTGSVTFTLTVNGIAPCNIVSDTMTLTITPAPVVNAGQNISTCSNSGAINISNGATASNVSSVLWTSSGTGTFTSANTLNGASYTPSSADITAGSVTLTLTANGISPCTSVFNTRTLTITPAPIVNAGQNDTTCSNLGAINISTGATASNFSSVLWTSSGSGTFTGSTTLNNAFYTPSIADIAAGTVTLTLTVNGNSPCSAVLDTKTLIINKESIEPDSISSSKKTICNGDSVTLTVAGGSLGTGASFKWYKNGCGSGTSIGTGNQITDAPSLGASTTPVTVTYFVRAEGAAAPCNAITNCASITITINPVPTINPTSDITVCGGLPVSIPLNVNTGIAGWINSNPAIGLGASGNGNINFNASNPNAPITATIRDSAIFTNAGLSCFSPTDVFVVTVNPTPSVNPTISPTICGGVPFSLTFSGNVTASGIAYNWTNSNTNIGLGANGTNQISFTPTNSSTTPITATINTTPVFTTPGATCPGTADNFSITINPTPVLSNSIVPRICSEIPLNSAIISTINSSNVTYSWTCSSPPFITGCNNQGFGPVNLINDILVNSSANSGTVTYTMFVNNTLNGTVCSDTLVNSVIVDPTPPTPIITELPGNNPVESLNLCVGSANITLGIGSNNGNILWSFNPSVSGDSITNPNDTITNIIIQSGSPTTITVTSADNTLPTKCVSKADNLVINVGANTISSNIIVPFGNVDLAYLDNSLNQYQWGVDSVVQVSNSFKVQQSKIINGQIYQLLVPPSQFILPNGKLDTLNYWYWILVYQVFGNDTCKTKIYFNGDYRCAGCKGVQPSTISADIVALAVPNPSSGIFTIKISGNIYGQLNAAIFNALGEIKDERKLLKKKDSEEFYYENLKLSSGIYFMHIRGEFGENTIVKLIIK